MEKAMATHSSTLAWKIPWMEEPGRLQSMGSLGVGHNWATSLSLFTFMHWRRKWQPTPVFLPGESQRWGNLVGCCLSGRTESDTTEATLAAAAAAAARLVPFLNYFPRDRKVGSSWKRKKLKGFLNYHWFPEARSQIILHAVITYFLVDSLILFEPILTL